MEVIQERTAIQGKIAGEKKYKKLSNSVQKNNRGATHRKVRPYTKRGQRKKKRSALTKEKRDGQTGSKKKLSEAPEERGSPESRLGVGPWNGRCRRAKGQKGVGRLSQQKRGKETKKHAWWDMAGRVG